MRYCHGGVRAASPALPGEVDKGAVIGGAVGGGVGAGVAGWGTSGAVIAERRRQPAQPLSSAGDRPRSGRERWWSGTRHQEGSARDEPRPSWPQQKEENGRSITTDRGSAVPDGPHAKPAFCAGGVQMISPIMRAADASRRPSVDPYQRTGRSPCGRRRAQATCAVLGHDQVPVPHCIDGGENCLRRS